MLICLTPQLGITPNKTEFAKAEELIWNAVAPRAAHQQQVENLVQTASHLGKTNLNEVRWSAQAKIHSIFYREFNQWALEIECKNNAKKAKLKSNLPQKPLRTKVKGACLFKLKAEYTTKQLDLMDNTINELEKENPNNMKEILSELSKFNKQSEIDNDAKYQKFKEASNAEIN
jgi:hypothetical protein